VEDQPEESPDDLWIKVRGLLHYCNIFWQKNYEVGTHICVDETMITWEGAGGGHLSYILRKPKPLGRKNLYLLCILLNYYLYTLPDMYMSARISGNIITNPTISCCKFCPLASALLGPIRYDI
jgi:hypothetical protein